MESDSDLAPNVEPSDFLSSDAGIPERWTRGFDRSRTWYLAGPMSGYPDHNFPAFARAAELLRQVTTIVSPHEITPWNPADDPQERWRQCMALDMAALLKCNGIILLKGWHASRGARLEFTVASALEYPVWFYDEASLREL